MISQLTLHLVQPLLLTRFFYLISIAASSLNYSPSLFVSFLLFYHTAILINSSQIHTCLTKSLFCVRKGGRRNEGRWKNSKHLGYFCRCWLIFSPYQFFVFRKKCQQPIFCQKIKKDLISTFEALVCLFESQSFILSC